MAMASTPRTRTTRRANTPGDASVTSTESLKPGVPWNIQKKFAQELENAFPLVHCPSDGNSVTALLNSGWQALAKFLDKLIVDDPENQNYYGLRGSDLRDQIGDLVQHWKKKDNEEYRRRVFMKLGIKQVKDRQQKTEEQQKNFLLKRSTQTYHRKRKSKSKQLKPNHGTSAVWPRARLLSKWARRTTLSIFSRMEHFKVCLLAF